MNLNMKPTAVHLHTAVPSTQRHTMCPGTSTQSAVTSDCRGEAGSGCGRGLRWRISAASRQQDLHLRRKGQEPAWEACRLAWEPLCRSCTRTVEAPCLTPLLPNKVPPAERLIDNWNVFLIILEAGSGGPGPLRALFWVSDLLTSFWGFCYKGTDPTHEGPAFRT